MRNEIPDTPALHSVSSECARMYFTKRHAKDENTLLCEQMFKDIGNHPNIIEFVRRTDSEESKFVSMLFKFYPYDDLRKYLNTHVYLQESLCIKIIKKILTALAHIHSHGYIHGDVKLENTLFDPVSESVKLCDLDYCKQWNPFTPMKKTNGTPIYIAPEMCNFKHEYMGPETDIWAVGVIAYICMYGIHPWGSWESTKTECVLNIAENNWKFRNDLRKTSSKFRNFVRECLTENPSERPTAEKLLSHEWLKNSHLYNLFEKKLIFDR